MYKYANRSLRRARSESALCPRTEDAESQHGTDCSQADVDDSFFSHNMGGLSIVNSEVKIPESDSLEVNSVDRNNRKAVSNKISVAMGEAATVKDDDTVLSTRGLVDCSALAVLSGWNGNVYKRRTLIHLKGSSLKNGLNNEERIYSLLSKLERSLADGGVVIWVAGTNSHSDVGIGMALDQQDEAGEKPFLKLLQAKGVSVVVAGSAGIKIMADGKIELREGTGRGVLSRESIAEIFDDISSP